MSDLLPQGAAMPAVLHDLRTWVGAISGWTRILTLRRSPAEVDRALRAIERSSDAMERFIADLTLLSRGTGSPFSLRVENVNLLGVIDAALDVVRPNAEANGVRLVWHAVSDCTPVVRGDPLRVQQIVCNLLANSLQCTPRGGWIVITLLTNAEHVRIAVEDSGPGISPAFLPSLFEPFTQDPAVQHAHGSGLGLAIAKTLAESQGGAIEVDPGGDTRGAIFRVQLPLVNRMDAPTSATA
jgi:signal transduction histidine kinase